MKLMLISLTSFKHNYESLEIFDTDFENLPEELTNLGQYSFCKAHAMSYAQLIYRLAELKHDNPQAFGVLV